MSGKGGIVAALFCIVALGSLILFAPLAFAVDGSSSSSAAEGNLDYSVVLGSIEGKLDDLATSEDVQAVTSALAGAATSEDIEGLHQVIESIAPVDNSERIDAMNEFFASLTTISVLQWVTLLMLVGVVLALVWLVSYRSHI